MIFSKLSIVIPVYNEAATIRRVLDKVKRTQLTDNIEKEVIVVNDCSSDNTGKTVNKYITQHTELDIQYFEHEVNMGKGAALHTGIAKAKGQYLIVQDADLEYDPEEYNALLDPVIRGVADVVYGSRFIGNQPHRVLFFWHTLGNKLLTFLSNMVNDMNLTDMETGYKVFRTGLLQNLSLKENRFGFEPEVTAKISRVPGIRIYEVGISYFGRTYEEGKKIRWQDGIRAIYCIIKYGLLKR